MAHLHGRKLRARLHQLYGPAHGKLPIHYAQIYDYAFIRIVYRIEDQRLQRRVRIALWRGDIGDYTFEHLLNADTQLGRDARRVQTGQADNILHLVRHALGLRAGQIDLVQNGHQLQIVLQRKVRVGQRLRLHTLAGVYHQHRALAGGQAAAHLVIKIHVPRRIDEVERIFLPVFCGILQRNGARLDRDAALALQFHIIQQLRLHFTLVHSLRAFQNAVCQSGFAVVDMRDDAEIANIFL